MKNDYVLHLSGPEANIRYLAHVVEMLDGYKQKYKKDFKYFLGMRKNWFGLILLPLAEEGNQTALNAFNSLLRDKRFNRVYAHAVYQDYIDKISVGAFEQEWILRFTAYESDMSYVYKVTEKIAKMYGIECRASVFDDNYPTYEL